MDTILPSNMPQNKPHYVYTYTYPESMGGFVFYIGKGRGKRIAEHEGRIRTGTPRRGDNSYKEGVIKHIWEAGEEVVKTKIAFFATHDEALAYEAALIILMRGYGHLTNLSDGWDGTQFHTLSDEARAKVGKSSTGRTYSEESRKRMSEAAKKRGFTEEHRRKITESLKGKTASDETRRKMSESRQKHITPEYRQKQSIDSRKRAESEEYRQQQREGAQRQWASEGMRDKMWHARNTSKG